MKYVLRYFKIVLWSYSISSLLMIGIHTIVPFITHKKMDLIQLLQIALIGTLIGSGLALLIEYAVKLAKEHKV
jgi:hypothetical protein